MTRRSDVFSDKLVTVELEGQPHGGALKRSHAEDGPLIPEDEGTPYSESRQVSRINQLPAFMRSSLQRLAYEVAAELEPVDEIFARYGYDEDGALELAGNPDFKKLYEHAKTEINDYSGSFKIKCRTMAEILLQNSFEMATDPLCPASVRADLIKWTAKMAELEPKTSKDDVKGAGSGLTIAITFAGGQKEVVGTLPEITRQPLTIENGSDR
jgi:hypothetical protein